MSEMLKLVAKSKIPSAQSTPPTNSHIIYKAPIPQYTPYHDMGASLLFFRPLLEHLVHVHGSLLQHLVPDVGVKIRGGLVVGVADDLHGHQRVDGRTGRESLRQDERGRHVGETTRHP